MRFTVRNDLLRRAIRLLSNKEKHVYPISLSASTQGETGSVTISTLEGIKFVSLSFNAEVHEEGEVLFSSRFLPYFDIEGDEVEFARKKGSFSVKSTYEYSIPLYFGEKPHCVKTDPFGSVTFKLDDIKNLFRRVLFAIGDDTDARHNFRCVLLECSANHMKAVGCDRRVVAMSKLLKGSPYRGKFVLPKGGMYIINKMEGDMVALTFYRNAIGFSTSGEIMCDVYIPEFAVSFPRYSDIMGVQGNTFIYGDREKLLTYISALRKVSNEIILHLRFDNYVKQHARMQARDDEGSRCSIQTDLDWDGDEIKIKLNARTIEGAIENARGKVTVAFTNDRGPLSVTGEGDDYISVMLPYSPAEKS